jgi:hypothetical protein
MGSWHNQRHPFGAALHNGEILMLTIFNNRQRRGLDRARFQYTTARKLGHNEESAMAGAIAAYILETDAARETAVPIVRQFLAIQDDIPGGIL